MGWIFYHRPPRDPKEEVQEILTSYSPEVPFTTEVVKHSVVGSTHYVAIRWTPKPGQSLNETYYTPDPETGAVTWAAVILTKRYQGEWGYKDMEESMGPVESKAPLSLIKLLSPTTNEYALEWRERCRVYAARPRPKIGDRVRLHTPWEPYGDEFVKVHWPRCQGVYQSVKTKKFVRLRTAEIAEIIT